LFSTDIVSEEDDLTARDFIQLPRNGFAVITHVWICCRRYSTRGR
jgi:hypothetical protein